MAKGSGPNYAQARANLSTSAIAKRGAALRAGAPMIGGGEVGDRDQTVRGNAALTGGSSVGPTPAKGTLGGGQPLGKSAQGKPSMGDGSNRLRMPGSSE